MGETQKEPAQPAEFKPHIIPTLSAVLKDGRLVELLYDADERSTRFAVWNGEKWEFAPSVRVGEEELVPYRPTNSLIKNHIVLFPSEPMDFGSRQQLLAELRAYLHRYVDLPESFETLAAHYALLTWVYDKFNELPYLRLRGDYGTGKTRFLLTLGSICYKPIFASGASSVSPLFHLLDRFGGTLIIDEADFRFSDEKSDLVKILNNGNVRGFPVLRSESKDGREFNPRAFQVFGPKVIAMRTHFDDTALESRFITETSGERALRKDIPINLPQTQRQEAEELRNKLLMFRFKHFAQIPTQPEPVDAALEPRINQIYAPLSAVMDDAKIREELRQSARMSSARLTADRSASMDAQILTAIRFLLDKSGKAKVSVKDIAEVFARAYAADYERPVSNRWLGYVIRRKLNLVTQKSHGNFVIPLSEQPKLKSLFDRYGVTTQDAEALGERVDAGDFGDVAQAATKIDGIDMAALQSLREGDGRSLTKSPSSPKLPPGP